MTRPLHHPAGGFRNRSSAKPPQYSCLTRLLRGVRSVAGRVQIDRSKGRHHAEFLKEEN
jgi:hypothetical protein